MYVCVCVCVCVCVYLLCMFACPRLRSKRNKVERRKVHVFIALPMKRCVLNDIYQKYMNISWKLGKRGGMTKHGQLRG